MKRIRLRFTRSGSPLCALSAAVILAVAFSSPVVADEPDSSAPATSGRKVKVDYIDEMLDAALKDAEISWSDRCTDAEFLRRAYLDLLGRTPNVQEAAAFLDGKDPGKREKMVNYLLENPDYPKYFGNTFTITLVGRRDLGRDADREALNSWMRRQFAANRPWNEIAYDIIAAKGSNKDNGAVNFTLAHMQDQAVNLTSFTTRIFLGQQIQCTQCHDHPSNDWKQQDFWGINAFFRGLNKENVMKVDASGAEVVDHIELSDEPTDSWARFEKRNAVVGVVPPTYLDGTRISPGMDVDRRVELAKLITSTDNTQFARAFVNRIWGHFMGRGFTNPVDDFGDHNPPSHPELLDRLTADFQANNYNVKDLIRWVTASKAYHVSSRMNKSNEKDDMLFSHYIVRPMKPEQLFDSLITATSAHKAAGKGSDAQRATWLRQFVVTFANDEAGETTNFQGTIPQALMMMNGDLMAKAVGGQQGSYLKHVLEQSRLQRKVPALRFIVNDLYLAALSRYPSAAELKRASSFLSSSPDTIAVIEDLFWALLNSNEFVLIH
ncbi:MAG TPA: DUF1553 domain-containing protein [Isosphaeraceae bacterium]|nr:DUF1553 domain-containing protein [Isosphaeraceae bacterium]